MSANDIPADFAPYFRSRHVVPARDPAQMRAAEALRFQIYCEECKFLPESQYPDKLESDDCDRLSAHFCTFNLREELIGYVRLVGPDAEGLFPFQHHGAALHRDTVLPPPARAAEISRLMVRRDYRRRRGDTLSGANVAEEDQHPVPERRNSQPQALLSMFHQMYLYSLENDVQYWYAAMERALVRSLSRMGFAFQQLGPETDYYGPVAPYLADLRKLEDAVGAASPPLMDWLRHPDAPQPRLQA